MKFSTWLQLKLIALTFAASLIFMTPGGAQDAGIAKPANIDRNGIIILIRSVISTVDHANITGNYTVLRDLGSPAFQSNTVARLAEVFAGLRQDKVDLSGAMVLEPQLNNAPQIESNGILRLAGFFPSYPSQINFELMFEPVNGAWKIYGVSVGISAPTSATPNVAAPAARSSGSSAQQTAPRQPASPSAVKR